MAKRDGRGPGQRSADDAPYMGDFQASVDENWSDEELERANTGWQAEDVQASNQTPESDDIVTEDDEVLDEAGEALTAMQAHELRRGQFHTPGDDENPGIDHTENAPKQDNMPDKKAGGSRGKSDFR